MVRVLTPIAYNPSIARNVQCKPLRIFTEYWAPYDWNGYRISILSHDARTGTLCATALERSNVPDLPPKGLILLKILRILMDLTLVIPLIAWAMTRIFYSVNKIEIAEDSGKHITDLYIKYIRRYKLRKLIQNNSLPNIPYPLGIVFGVNSEDKEEKVEEVRKGRPNLNLTQYFCTQVANRKKYEINLSLAAFKQRYFLEKIYIESQYLAAATITTNKEGSECEISFRFQDKEGMAGEISDLLTVPVLETFVKTAVVAGVRLNHENRARNPHPRILIYGIPEARGGLSEAIRKCGFTQRQDVEHPSQTVTNFEMESKTLGNRLMSQRLTPMAELKAESK